MRTYNTWINTVPDQLAVYGMFRLGALTYPTTITINTTAVSPFYLCLQAIYHGPYEDGLKLAQPLLDHSPTTYTLCNCSLIEYEMMGTNVTAVDNRAGYIKSGYLARHSLSDYAISVLAQGIVNAPSNSSTLLWVHSGGAIASQRNDDTAYFHRDPESHQFLLEGKAIWVSEAESAQNIQWLTDVFAKLSSNMSGAYVNYIDPYLPNWATEYYGTNLPRLVSVKASYDPQGFFHQNQTIPNSLSPPDSESGGRCDDIRCVGIIIGSVAGGLVLIGAIWWSCKRSLKQSSDSKAAESTSRPLLNTVQSSYDR
jgi:hypothetical protein